MSSDKINIWAVTDGSKGMISQVMGLSNQISKNIKEIKTDLIFPWNKIQAVSILTYFLFFGPLTANRTTPAAVAKRV